MAILSFTFGEWVYAVYFVSEASLLYLLSSAIYNLYFHSLSRYPGPFFRRTTRLSYIISCWIGRLHSDVHSFHKSFGPVIRIAPNELSFAAPAAIEDIYSNRGDSNAFPKSAVWHGAQPGQLVNLNNMLDAGEHRRVRRRMEGAFTERSLGRQEGIVMSYVDLLMQKFKEMIKRGEGEAIVDVVPWFTYCAVDIMGDLAFGESFQCLGNGAMDQWIGWVFGSLKAMTCVAVLRYYPLADSVLQWCVPGSAKRKIDELWDAIIKKVDVRLARKTDRPDFISEWQREGKRSEERLSRDDIYANAFLILIAGSETTGTAMSGIVNRLVKKPEVVKLLTGRCERRLRLTRTSLWRL